MPYVTVAHCESPRKSLTLKNEPHRTTSHIVNDDANTAAHNGSGTVDDQDLRRWPSVETQADLYGHADTSSLGDFAVDSQNGKVLTLHHTYLTTRITINTYNCIPVLCALRRAAMKRKNVFRSF